MVTVVVALLRGRGVVVGGLWGRAVDLVGHLLDEPESEPPLVAHQADGGLVDDLVEDHEVIVLEAVLGAVEVVVQVVLQLGLLLPHVGEVDEEAGAHVPLHVLHLLRPRRLVRLTQQVAVLQQATAPDLLGVFGRYLREWDM